MTLNEILEKLITIENELDDATNSLPDWNGNTDSRSNIDGAKCELYHLKDEIERSILDLKKDEDILYNRTSK
jgi:peptidoglycan hydrolase CwlO-like protein